MNINAKNLVNILFKMDGRLKAILLVDGDIEDRRKALLDYLNEKEAFWHSRDINIHPLELVPANRCLASLRKILSPRNERMAGFSTLQHLMDIANGRAPEEGSRGFLLEIIHLVEGINGRTEIYPDRQSSKTHLKGRKAAIARSKQLDTIAKDMNQKVGRYKSGLEPDIVRRRIRMKKKIQRFFKASEDDWMNYRWHFRHVLRDFKTISALVKLGPHEKEAVKLAEDRCIPFGITPYYLSLFDEKAEGGFDRAIRAQVIMSPAEVKALADGREADIHALDFMLESETSPENLITRRYPQIAIFKPVNTCPQICSYCQRNWEVDPPMTPGAYSKKELLDRALDWFAAHRYMTEILITGGDPLLLGDRKLEYILERIAAMKHIQRIRLGTRIPVTVPFRITDSLMKMVEKYHEPGKREVAFVTHFEHVAEITPEAVEALSKIKRKGLSIYNQTVYTYFNSKRFENVALRKLLRLSGVDPYYTFNTKGKEETKTYIVPIARLLQEAKEEARIVPGMDRTDEPVFNIPALGKNYLKAAQNHDIIAINPDGSRMIEFHPWEKNIKFADTYVFKDVPIYDYLKRLEDDGEDIREYRTIWYYF